MFKYDSDSNTLIEVTETTFSDNNILERDHIEEWIRKKPDILGEELLMIGHDMTNSTQTTGWICLP